MLKIHFGNKSLQRGKKYVALREHMYVRVCEKVQVFIMLKKSFEQCENVFKFVCVALKVSIIRIH